jgi:biopolymer transport protein TolQ
MQIANSEELEPLRAQLPAGNTGAVTPFIGLFGTVWGIIDAFHGLGTSRRCDPARGGAGHLRGVDYNRRRIGRRHPRRDCLQFDRRVNSRITSRGDDFALEMLNAVERQQPQPAYRTAEAPGVTR